jgi:REP element-mobilizing transposase RayT
MAAARPSKQRQTGFVFRSWGGRRKGAGRKPQGDRAGVSHRRREALASRFPVHVTLRVVLGLGNLRARRCIRAIEHAFIDGNNRLGFRLVHYSVQKDHIHLLCEARDARSLSRGMQGLCIRLARRLNRVLQRRGRVFADRYHARVLKTPREVHAVLRYLLGNVRKHTHRQQRHPRWVDPCSSAAYFDGWRGVRMRAPPGPRPVAEAHSWLVQTGWRRCGLLTLDAAPASPAKGRRAAR